MSDPRQLQFWDDEGSETWNAMNELLMLTFFDGVEIGVDTIPDKYRVLVDFDYINQSALDFARNYRYEQIKGINETTRVQTQQAITDWMREGSPLSALEAKLAPIFSPARAEAIAVTEVTRAYSEGNTSSWKATGGVVSGEKWNTSEDEKVCPICNDDLKGVIAPVGGEFVGKVSGKKYKQPAHVRDRCWKTPVVDEKAVKAKFAEIFK